MVTSISARNNSPIYLANTTNKSASLSFYTGSESWKCPGNRCDYTIPAGAWGIKTGNAFPGDYYGFFVNWNGHKIYDSHEELVQGSGSISIQLKPGTSSARVCINCF